jgi:ATP-dependent exoDNAse (exonuclease V) alpha subunit
MALYFLDMKTFGRSDGSSAPSAAAYRSGERIRDERTGRTYDHTDRQDVMHKEILLPSGVAGEDMSWATDRSSLWNAAEAAESRKNARVAREYLIALPEELTHPQRVEVVHGFAQELAERFGFAVDVAVHAPRNFRGSDPRNFHAHLLATTREVSPEGLGRKTTLDLNDDNRRRLGLGPAVRELLYVRRRWAEVANIALEAAHVDARIDHRSLAARGITREPKLWIPRVPFEIERRGGRSFVAEQVREDHRARQAPQRAGAESRNLEPARDSSTRSPDIARQAVEKWLQYRHDVQKYGEARAAERHFGQSPAAGRGQENDLAL